MSQLTEAVRLNKSLIPYIANHAALPISDIQAAAEYFLRTHPSGVYFVLDWSQDNGRMWSCLSAERFNQAYYFSQPERKNAFQIVRERV